jgi:hypothetical protein
MYVFTLQNIYKNTKRRHTENADLVLLHHKHLPKDDNVCCSLQILSGDDESSCTQHKTVLLVIKKNIITYERQSETTDDPFHG